MSKCLEGVVALAFLPDPGRCFGEPTGGRGVGPALQGQAIHKLEPSTFTTGMSKLAGATSVVLCL